MIGIDFVNRGNSHVFSVRSVEDSDRKRCGEHAAIHPKSGPSGSFVKRLEVFRIV